MKKEAVIEKMRFAIMYLNEIFQEFEGTELTTKIREFRNGLEDVMKSVANGDYAIDKQPPEDDHVIVPDEPPVENSEAVIE